MTFRPGTPKPPNSGIKKGQKHKAPEAWKTVRERLLENGVDLVQVVLDALAKLEKDPYNKAKIALQLMEYSETKLHRTELSLAPQTTTAPMLQSVPIEYLEEQARLATVTDITPAG